jgi:hypothetical protein
VSLSKFSILGQHVGQSGGVRQKMLQQNTVAAVSTELRNEPLDSVRQCYLAAIYQRHNGRGGHRLRQRSKQKDGIHSGSFTKGTLDCHCALANEEDSSRHVSRVRFRA